MPYCTERRIEERWHLECRIKSGPPHMRAEWQARLAEVVSWLDARVVQ